VKRNTDHLKEGSIKVYNDNLKMIQDINDGMIKVSDGVKDGWSSIYAIIKMIKIIKVQCI